MTDAIEAQNATSPTLAERDLSAAEVELRVQKALLESQVESSIEGVLLVDATGRMVSFNRRFVEMWGIPADVVKSRSDEAALQSVLEQLVHPEEFLERVHYLYEHPEEESREEIELIDGRSFDRYSAPVKGPDGTISGRVWYFRDITETRRHEQELERRLAQLQSIYGVAAVVARAESLEDVLDEALERLQNGVRADRGAVLLLEEDGRMRFRAWRGLSDAYRAAVEGHSPWRPGDANPEPVVVADVEADPGLVPLRDAIVAEGIRSLAFVPLVQRGQLIGKLVLYWDDPHVLGAEDLSLAQAIATHLASAAERRRAERALAESRDQLEIIFQGVGDGITVQDSTGRLIFANEAAARMIGLESPDDVVALSPADILSRFELLDEVGSPVAPEDLPPRHSLAGAEAEMVVGYRIRATGDVRWSLVKSTPVRGEGGAVELAITIFHDITERRRAGESVRFLARASEVLAESLDYARTLVKVSQIAVPRLADWCMVYMVQPDGSIERLAVHHAGGLHENVLDRLREYPFDPDAETGVPAVLRSGSSLLVPDADGAQVAADVIGGDRLAEELELLGIKSWMCVPLSARGRTLGAISLLSAESGRRFGEGDLALAEELAGRAALAVDNARLYEETQALLEAERRARATAEESAETLRRLQLVTEASLGHLALDDLLGELLERIRDLLGVDTAAVLLLDVDAGDLVARVAKGLEEEVELGIRIPYGVGFAGKIAAELKPVHIPDVEHADLFNPLIKQRGIKSLLGVPLRAEDRLVGVLHVGTLTPRSFEPDDTVLLQLMADRVTAAIEQSSLYEKEREARAAAEERARAAQALRFVGDGVFLVDRDGYVRVWNPAAQAITGLAESSVVGRPAAEAIPSWTALEELARVGVASERSTKSRPQAIPLELEGRELWLSISGVEFAEGTVFAFRDITEERGVDKLKSDFVSTVSHELRTPLAAIYGAALTLQRDDILLELDQRSDLLTVIAGEAERLARIVNDILWASRLEASNLEISIESCDAAQIAGAVVRAASLHVPGSIELVVDAPDDLPRVAADPDKVRQVLGNLVENAVKYSPDGGRVDIRLRQGEGVVRFSVTDRGLGIPATEQERIFEKFYRLDPHLTRGVGGTGLGLYICLELVRRMDGRIWVESRVGEGSTFFVELPQV